MRKITEEGARFRSPVDGAEVFLSPEESMRIQRALASDIAMSFDECTPYPATEDEARASMELSMRWALRGYVDVIRGIPSLVLIFFSFYGTALLGLNISAFAAGVLALAAFCAAHVGELTRGAVQSIPHAQTDAAKSIGLGFWGRLTYAILPQALRRMLPAWVHPLHLRE